MNLSIIILTYNTKDLTIRCLESLIKQFKNELREGELEIIVVDNASTDGSAETIGNFIRQIGGSNFKFIKNKENLGFAKGCNIGGGVAKGKYILFLNSDTQSLDRGFLKMVDFLDSDKKIAILGGKLLNPDGSPQASCGKFYTLFNLFLMLAGLENFLKIRKSPDKISKVDWISGGCMMVKKSLFENFSGFDENYFMYMEDMDLCFRANKLGFATYFYPDAKVLHKELGSSNKAFAITNIYKGILHFYAKHKDYFQYTIAKALLIAKAKISIVIGILTGNSILIKTYTSAVRF